MKISFKSLFLASVLFLGVSGILSAQSPDLVKGIWADSLFSQWKLANHPGGTAAWIENGQIRWSGAYGMASLEYQVPITTETVFNTGSVSKQFTAFAIVLLALDGKLSLDDDLRKYLYLAWLCIKTI